MRYIEYNKANRIGYITLNRSEKRNALNYELISELKSAFTIFSKDDEVKIVVLKATGSVFSAGADLEYLQQLQQNTYEENLHDSSHLKELFYQIYTLEKVVIAQVQGHAIAGGCGLVSVCDFVFTVPEAKFGYTEVRIGFIPAIVKVFLLRRIGEMKAKELLLTGELISASKASEFGLVNKIVENNNIAKEVEDFAGSLITNNSSQSMSLIKKMVANVQSMSLEEGLEYATEMNAKARTTTDCKKGIAAFLKKQQVKW